MADAARAARLADRIKVIVAQALERRVKDPPPRFCDDYRCPGHE